MKVILKDLKPNPFKKFINEGKFNQIKIEQLKESIDKDGFWDNVICRKDDGKYELAYGHHRIEAAKQVLGRDFEVNIPCKDLSDEQMLRILGNENNTTNEEYTIYQIDQVIITKKFLEEHPQVVHAMDDNFGKRKGGFDIQPGSSESISLFLGGKNWEKSKVAGLLRMYEKLHPRIISDMTNAANIGNDKRTVSKTHGLHLASLENKKDQIKAYKIIKKHGLSERQTQVLVSDIKHKKEIPQKIQSKLKPTLEEVIRDIVKKLIHIRPILENIIPYRKEMRKNQRLLLDSCLSDYRNLITKYFREEIDEKI